MVYSQEFLDTTLDNINSFIAQSAGASAPTVQVKFGGSGVHDVGGPTPFVDISMNVENNSIGIPESTTTRITLTGKIVRPQAASATGSGISHVLSGIKDLHKIFDPSKIDKFEITCGTTSPSTIYSATGVKVVSVDVAKTNDNWVQTADYTVVLEVGTSLISGYSVKNLVDSWSIEPLEDYTYSKFTISAIAQKSEYHNPNLKPTAPSDASPQPAGNQTGASANGVADLDVISIPQFKVTHTVSAVGIPSGTGSTTGIMNSTYLNAKNWVDARLGLGNNINTPSGIISLNNNNVAATPNYHLATGYLYNHMRNTNFSIMEGKYEVVDNWLAMPTGIGFIEDYSIDMSTDDKYIHTVSVKGEIKGLSLGFALNDPPIHTHVTGFGTNPTINRLNLSATAATGYEGSLSHKVPDVLSSNSQITNMFSNRYENALSGWIYDVKPYLYRRACVAMTAKDRIDGYVPPVTVINGSNTQAALKNPVYSKHGLLNIVPISTSESYNTRKGIISYDYQFNNKFTIISGVISESISIEDTGPADVIGEAFVLGRALGPVLQNLGTKTSAKKSVTVEVTVVPPSSLGGFFMQNSECPLWTGGKTYQAITGIVEGLKPFGDRPTSMFGNPTVIRGGGATNASGQVYVSRDDQSWDPTNGRYVRSMTWTHQQCQTNKNWLDH